MTKVQLRRGMSVWDATGKHEQAGFAKSLIMLGEGRNRKGMVQVQCTQTGRRGWVHPDELAAVRNDPGEAQTR